MLAVLRETRKARPAGIRACAKKIANARLFRYHVPMNNNNNTARKLAEAGLAIPDLLLPKSAGLEKWAAVACDQYTQDRGYWEKAAQVSGGQPTSLRLILPEVYLEDGDRAERIARIHADMASYLSGGAFAEPSRGFVYLERDTPLNRRRRGLVVAVDLERYSWASGALPLIRPTEGTVAERLPPRMEVRRNAPLESSHIIMLIDDEADEILPAVGERARENAPAYSGDLMMDSGSIKGWLVDSDDDLARVADALSDLRDKARSRYSQPDGVAGEAHPFLFAIGDGNHSLASAKEIWEEYKAQNAPSANGEPPDHPCRYAIVELENIYDPAITFEPIHRVVFGLDFDGALALLSALPDFASREVPGERELAALVAEPVKGNRFGLSCRGRHALVETSAKGISTASLQPLLDAAVGSAIADASSIDYIHGEPELFRLALSTEKLATGMLLPPVQKDGFFETIARTGPLPRKSFSMGEACEKRFYIECRKLFA